MRKIHKYTIERKKLDLLIKAKYINILTMILETL